MEWGADITRNNSERCNDIIISSLSQRIGMNYEATVMKYP